MQDVGFPDGVLNLVTGYWDTVGKAIISTHMKIGKYLGRKIMDAG
jgi:acyl-CoA reductase-like NAD-dependent aldehyde dehydrogenase